MLLRPIFSEKSQMLTALNKYTFRVDPKATKTEIKKLVENLYKVNVVSIATAKLKTRSTRSMRTGKSVKERGYKKAIVELKSGQKINLFTA